MQSGMDCIRELHGFVSEGVIDLLFCLLNAKRDIKP